MKRLTPLFLIICAALVVLGADRKIINPGTTENDGLGETPYQAFTKVNENFAAVWGGTNGLGVGPDTAYSARLRTNSTAAAWRTALGVPSSLEIPVTSVAGRTGAVELAGEDIASGTLAEARLAATVVRSVPSLWSRFFGDAGNTTQTGPYNTGVGYTALRDLTSGQWNTALGVGAGQQLTTGHGNVALGVGALPVSLTATGNVAVGRMSLNRLVTGTNNVAVGNEALLYTTNSHFSTAVGYHALETTSNSVYNTAIGWHVLAGNQGNYNTAVGVSSFLGPSEGGVATGGGNAGLGANSGYNNRAGNYNVAIGQNALFTNQDGDYNIGIGMAAGYDVTGSRNICIGPWTSPADPAGTRQLNIGCVLYGTGLYHGPEAHSDPVDGKVGVNVAAPAYTLDVRCATGAPFGWGSPTNELGHGILTYGVAADGDDGDAIIKATAGYGLGFQVDAGALTPMVINKNGKVGIGGQAPLVRLDVRDDVTYPFAWGSSTQLFGFVSYGSIIQGSTGDAKIVAREHGGIVLQPNGGAYSSLVINTNGLVGVNNVDPQHPLDVRSDDAEPFAWGTPASKVAMLTQGAINPGDTSDGVMKAAADNGLAFQVNDGAVTPLTITKTGEIDLAGALKVSGTTAITTNVNLSAPGGITLQLQFVKGILTGVVQQ